MLDAAEQLEFERAAVLRDWIDEMKKPIGRKTKLIDFKKKPKKRRR